MSFVAALAPMLTWSSCPFELTIESTEAGVHSCLFWLTRLAATYWGIMNPEFRPASWTRYAGRRPGPDNNWNVRRSLMLANSARAIARKSIAKASG
jgi:hypothetical protein